jgi:hypothetical protein
MQPRAEEEVLEARALAYTHTSTGLHTRAWSTGARSSEQRSSELTKHSFYAICGEQSKCSNSVNQSLSTSQSTLSIKVSITVCQSKCTTLLCDSKSALKQGMPARTHTTLFEEESDHMVLVLRGCPRAASFSSHVPRACVRRRAHRLPVPVLIAGASARARGGAKHGTARAFHGEQASALHQPERERERKEEQDRRDGERCC